MIIWFLIFWNLEQAPPPSSSTEYLHWPVWMDSKEMADLLYTVNSVQWTV